MLARVSTITLILALMAQSFAAPAAQPAHFEAEGFKRANFETDPMLQVGGKAASSYAETN
ncbi:hypothetical protein F4805DRAFT_206482 [Annulohypoxylon moriforme]|nr:hypothetical protein F4805DRAFT_206482 [Annulohypoxylon moriforme]